MGRKITAREVAQAAGVSASTVDRVLNDRGGVNPLKERAVLAAARRLGLDRALNQRAARVLRIAVLLQPPTNPFHAAVAEAFEAAARRFSQFNLQFRLFHIDPSDRSRIARRVAGLASDYDGIVIVSAYDGQIAEALSAFSNAGKPVIALATDFRGQTPHQYIGPDNLRSGRVAGNLMGRFLGQSGGKVLAIGGLFSMIGQEERLAGFQAVLSESFPHVQLVDVLESREDGARAGEIVAETLRRHPDLCGIYNASAGAGAVADVLKRSGRSRQVVFITHELSGEYRSLLKAGLIDAIIDQDPEHEVLVAVETLAAHFGRTAPSPRSLITPVHIHTMETC